MKKGRIFLLTGISGSGKTTLGRVLKDFLKEKNQRSVEFIDGDMVRNFLETDLVHTIRDRLLITKQIAYAAYLLSKHGIDVVIANIAGQRSVRDYLKRRWNNYIQIFLDVDVDDCIKNDPKGVYKRAMQLKHPHLVGLDIPYEKPLNPDITLYPYRETVEESLERILSFLKEKNLIK